MCAREFRQPHMYPGQCACSEKPEKMLGLLQAGVCAPHKPADTWEGSSAPGKSEGLGEQFCFVLCFFLFLAPGIQRNFFQNTSWSKVRNSDLSDHIPEKIQFCSKKFENLLDYSSL